MSYEQQDASLRIIGTTAVLLVFGLALSLGATAWWYHRVDYAAGASKTVIRQTSFTDGPAAEPDILRDRRDIGASAAKRLHGYAWVDREGEIARIPIERAMALVVDGVRPAPAPKEVGEVP